MSRPVRKLQPARSTPVEAFAGGDEGSFTWKDDDVTVTHRGIVAHVARHGRMRHLISGSGKTLAMFDVGEPGKVVAIMIRRYVPQQPGLFDVGVEDG